MSKNQKDLEEYVTNAGVWHRFVEKPETVHTAIASRATGIDLNRITKKLVCRSFLPHSWDGFALNETIAFYVNH